MKKKITKKVPSKKPGKKKSIKKPTRKTVKKPVKKIIKEKLALVGVVTHYYDKIKVAIFKVKSPIQIGQKLRFTNTEGTLFEQPIVSIQINHEGVKKAKKGAIIGMKVKKQVHENNKVYLIK
jgi:DNA integrity scanning protein DisA with diadenylate cyclase activity